jgi:hypothetical protein
MTIYTKTLLLLMLSTYFVSCGHKETKKEEWEIKYDKEKELDSLNQLKSSELSLQRSAISGWDTSKLYTYQLQEIFSSEGKPIAFIGNINDIIKKDSIYILKIYGSTRNSTKTYIAEITANISQLDELKKQFNPHKHKQKGCFIFKVVKIQSIYPKLSSEVETDGPDVDDASSYLTFNFDETLIQFKGILIDYYLFKEIQDSDE